MSFFRNKHNEVRAVWKILPVVPALLILTAMLTICFAFFYALIYALTTNVRDPAAISESIITGNIPNDIIGIIQNIMLISLVVVFWKIFEKRPLSQMGLTFDKAAFADLAYGLILGAVSIALVFFILLLTGQIIVEKSVLKPNFAWLLLVDLVTMIFVGIGEEMYSRGYCMTVLRRSGIIVIVIVPNVIFSLLHIFNNNIGIIPLVNLFLIGLLFSFMFLRRGNIWMPIGYHITWNFFQGSVFGLPVSGSSASGLFASKLVGENIFNGGGFGPEGGLIVTGLIIVSIALLFVLTKDKAVCGIFAAGSDAQPNYPSVNTLADNTLVPVASAEKTPTENTPSANTPTEM